MMDEMSEPIWGHAILAIAAVLVSVILAAVVRWRRQKKQTRDKNEDH